MSARIWVSYGYILSMRLKLPADMCMTWGVKIPFVLMCTLSKIINLCSAFNWVVRLWTGDYIDIRIINLGEVVYRNEMYLYKNRKNWHCKHLELLQNLGKGQELLFVLHQDKNCFSIKCVMIMCRETYNWRVLLPQR